MRKHWKSCFKMGKTKNHPQKRYKYGLTHEKLKLKPHRGTISHPSGWQIVKSLAIHIIDETIRKSAVTYLDGGGIKWFTPTRGNLSVANKTTAILPLGIYHEGKPSKQENTQVQGS